MATDPLTTEKAVSIRADKLIKSYTRHSEAALFTAPARNNELPVELRDGIMAKRQRALGATGHAVCTAMDNTHLFIQAASQAVEEGDLARMKTLVNKFKADDVRPLGHSLRIIASEYQSVMRERRELCLKSIR